MNEDVSALERKWQRDAKKLLDDCDAFWDYFHKHRKCSCEEGECKHFERALWRVLGERAEEIDRAGVNISIITYSKFLK